VHGEIVAIALGDDPAVLHHQQRCGLAALPVGAPIEGRLHGLVQRFHIPARPRQRRPVAHRPGEPVIFAIAG
jgi:hypothetical protein